MRKILSYKIVGCLFLFCILMTNVQSQKLNELETAYRNYHQKQLTEIAYLQTDKSTYLAGEIIWFKTYIVNNINHRLLNVSKVIYVELLDAQNTPVLQEKISLNNGVGSGSFLIPFSVASGEYKIRAYTNWMKNFGAEDFFENRLTVINSTISSKMPQKSVKPDYSIAFFPEGGHLVNKLESRIGFKISNGLQGLEGKGFIINQLKDTVAQFATYRFGMGNFNFTPVAGNDYTAVVTLSNGKTIEQKLPEISIQGYVVQVSEVAGNFIEVSVKTSGIETIQEDVYVIAHKAGKISYASRNGLQNQMLTFHIHKDSLPEGITEITVFNSSKQPVAERLYFKRPKSKMDISINISEKIYRKRSPVNIDISTKNNSGHPVSGNLSASVYRLNDLQTKDEGNILSYLWLSSAVSGNIENPEYYFETNDEEALTNLLLTQGWRKFDWESAMNSGTPQYKYVPEFAAHIISARLTNEKTGAPAAGITVFLSVPGKRIQVKAGVTNQYGIVHFEMQNLAGVNQLVLQTNSPKPDYRFEILSPFSEQFTANRLSAFDLNTALSSTLKEEHLNMQVQYGYHHDELHEMTAFRGDSLPFYYAPYKSYQLDNFRRFTTLEEVLREYISEINIRKTGPKYRIIANNVPSFKLKLIQEIEKFEENAFVLLDGVPVFDMDKMMAYDPLKIEKAEVVPEGYTLGPVNMEGIISFTTYKGNLEGFKLNEGDLLLDYEGLQQQREFYSPKYETKEQQADRVPDFRNVLLWSPDLKTNAAGEGRLSFYTGDLPGRYMIAIEGIGDDGNAGVHYETFEVR